MNIPLSLNETDSAALDDFVARLRAALGPNLVALTLFGSKARGDDTPDSDIDVLVTVDEETPGLEDRVLHIAFEVNLEHEVFLTPLVMDRAVQEHPVWQHTGLLRAVAREGIPL